MKKVFYQSPFGSLILIVHGGRLFYCNWDTPDCLTKQKTIEKLLNGELEGPEDEIVLKEVTRQLDEYFAGERKIFDIPLELVGSDFRKKVWKSLLEIGYGSTSSYKKIGEKVGGANKSRAVAQACGANPVSIIIPCHRVVASDGNSGGYTGGIDKKIALLNLETELLKQ